MGKSMEQAEGEVIWEGICILEKVSLIERPDGRSEVALVWKEGGEKRLRQFLRCGAKGQSSVKSTNESIE